MRKMMETGKALCRRDCFGILRNAIMYGEVHKLQKIQENNPESIPEIAERWYIQERFIAKLSQKNWRPSKVQRSKSRNELSKVQKMIRNSRMTQSTITKIVYELDREYFEEKYGVVQVDWLSGRECVINTFISWLNERMTLIICKDVSYIYGGSE